MTLIGPQAWADGNATAEPMELRRIMRELGNDMQVVTDGISREDWERVAKTAPKIAEHRQPPFAEKMRILAFAGSNDGWFKRFDEQTHQTAKSFGTGGQGAVTVKRRSHPSQLCKTAAWLVIRNSRKPFVEHFYGQP